MMHRLCRLTLRANGFRNNNAAALSRQQVRAYLGGVGDMISRRDNANKDEVAKREQELWDRAQPRAEEIMERHLRLPTA